MSSVSCFQSGNACSPFGFGTHENKIEKNAGDHGGVHEELYATLRAIQEYIPAMGAGRVPEASVAIPISLNKLMYKLCLFKNLCKVFHI